MKKILVGTWMGSVTNTNKQKLEASPFFFKPDPVIKRAIIYINKSEPEAETIKLA